MKAKARKHKPFYQTTWFTHWWDGRRWIRECKAPCSSNRDHKTAKSAWRDFNSHRDEEFRLLKWERVKGRRVCSEWWWTRRREE